MINEDLQLAAFGLLNTLLALMVRDSLGHVTNVMITEWMISTRGASTLDFDLYDETIKPWIAVSNAHTRRKRNGWRMRDFMRVTACTVIGFCLLLQGASMNTIGIPKMRWWPDTRFIKPDPKDGRLFFNTTARQVANVSFMPLWQRSFDMIKEGDLFSWEIVSINERHRVFLFLTLISLRHMP